jgi:hypothetical protein
MTRDAASARLYIACRKPTLLAVYDTRTGALLSRTPRLGDVHDKYLMRSLNAFR